MVHESLWCLYLLATAPTAFPPRLGVSKACRLGAGAGMLGGSALSLKHSWVGAEWGGLTHISHHLYSSFPDVWFGKAAFPVALGEG